MGNVTPKGLLNLLGDESRQRERINSYYPVTEKGMDELISTSYAERDPFSFYHRVRSAKNGGPYGTNGNHVGRELLQKQKPDTLDVEGPNPLADRAFIGDEFQGMLMFGTDGAPAFKSLWPADASDAERKVLKVNIARTLPQAMDALPPVEKKALERRAGVAGQSLQSQFTPTDARIEKAIQSYARRFEQAFGIHLDIGHDKADAQIHVMGYKDARADSPHAYASFPGAMDGWKELAPLSHSPGYVMVNQDSFAKLSDKQVDELVAHEFGHALGLAGPHNLALFRTLSSREAVTLTSMAYSDLAYGTADETSAHGFGALDLGLRKWLPNPPALDNKQQTYDLEALHKASLQQNKRSITYRKTALLPVIPIVANNAENVLYGTSGNDFIDTNPGYLSRMVTGSPARRQSFALMEGHIGEVYCQQGDNKVVASAVGDQTIHTGAGHTEVRLLYPLMTGAKTIDAEGDVTLSITASYLKQAQDMAASAQGRDVVLSTKGAELRLEGQAAGEGITRLRVLSERGRVLFEKETKGLSLDELKNEVLEPALQTAKEYVPSKPDVAQERPNDWKDRVERLKAIEASKGKNPAL